MGVIRLTDEFYTDRGYEQKAEKELTPSMEDYLEMIYRLSDCQGYTRVSKVAERLNVKPASVTKMTKKLWEKSYLEYEKYGMIHLTNKGCKLGDYLLRRHNLLEEFFQTIGAKGDLRKEVERIEHHISFENFQKLSVFLDFLKEHPKLLSEFESYRNKQSQ